MSLWLWLIIVYLVIGLAIGFGMPYAQDVPLRDNLKLVMFWGILFPWLLIRGFVDNLK